MTTSPPLLRLAAGTLLAAIIALATVQPAFAAPSAVPSLIGLPAITMVKVTTSASMLSPGELLSVTASVAMSDGSAPSGLLTAEIISAAGTTPFMSAHVTRFTVLTGTVNDWPFGAFTVRTLFQPDMNSGQSSGQASAPEWGYLPSRVELLPGTLIAGQVNRIGARVDIPSGEVTPGGKVSLTIGSTTDAATCVPALATPASATCTLVVPAQTAGTLSAAAHFIGSTFYVPSVVNVPLTFTAPPAPPAPPTTPVTSAPKAAPPSPKSTEHTTATHTTASSPATHLTASPLAGSPTSVRSPVDPSPTAASAPGPAAPSSAVPGPATAHSTAGSTGAAVRPTSTSSPLATPFLLVGGLSAVIVAAIAAAIVLRRRASR